MKKNYKMDLSKKNSYKLVETKPLSNDEKAYKKCPGCGHTFWDMPCKEWGETGPTCHYCIEEEQSQDQQRDEMACKWCKSVVCDGYCEEFVRNNW